MTLMMCRSRRWSGRIAVTLLAVFIDAAHSAGLHASDEVRITQLSRPRAEGIRARMRRLASTEAARLTQEQPQAADPARALCSASLAEKAASVFSLGVGSIMFGYGLREKEKKDTIWTPDGKSEVAFGAAAIGLSFWLFHDIRNRARQCKAIVAQP